MNLTRPTRCALPVLLLATILTGCSGAQDKTGADNQPEVATLETSTPGKGPKATKAPASDSGRPRERLDMTVAERERLCKPYQDCHEQHLPKSEAAKKKGTDPTAEAELRKACGAKEPLPPWELDSNNPDALDFARKVVTCLRGKGVKYAEVSPDPDQGVVSIALGGKGNDAVSITRGLGLMSGCHREAAGG